MAELHCLPRLAAFDEEEEAEHFASLQASVRAIGNLRHAHPDMLRRLHAHLTHGHKRYLPLVHAAAESLMDVAHAASEAPLIEALRRHSDRHVHHAILRTLRSFEVRADCVLVAC